jgi:hypothetical protein
MLPRLEEIFPGACSKIAAGRGRPSNLRQERHTRPDDSITGGFQTWGWRPAWSFPQQTYNELHRLRKILGDPFHKLIADLADESARAGSNSA